MSRQRQRIAQECAHNISILTRDGHAPKFVMRIYMTSVSREFNKRVPRDIYILNVKRVSLLKDDRLRIFGEIIGKTPMGLYEYS